MSGGVGDFWEVVFLFFLFIDNDKGRRIRRTGRKGEGERAHASQSAVAAHAVSKDADALPIYLCEVFENGEGELRGDVAVHSVPFVPGGLGRVDVEAGAAAKVVGVVFALDFQTT